jgi:hypothetical protein
LREVWRWFSEGGGDGNEEDLAKFGYKLNTKIKFQKINILLYFWLAS